MYNLIISLNGVIASYTLNKESAEEAINNAVKNLSVTNEKIKLSNEGISLFYGDKVYINALPIFN
jgi:hypothetical protein